MAMMPDNEGKPGKLPSKEMKNVTKRPHLGHVASKQGPQDGGFMTKKC